MVWAMSLINQEKTKIIIRPTLTLFYTLICCTENVKLEFIVSKSDSENITLVFPRLEKDLYDIADTSIKLRDPAEPSCHKVDNTSCSEMPYL